MCSGTALGRAVVADAGGRILTRASSLPVSVNGWHTLRMRTGRLAAGTYTVAIRAMDKAHNFQRGVTRIRLTVR